MDTGDPRIDWAIGHIEHSLQQPLRVSDMAQTVNLSTSQFTRLFRAATGVAPARYIQLRRLERARLLIARTFLTIKEVMGQVGYNDPSHFTRDFSREYGAPPSRVRASQVPKRTADIEPGG
jgi:transcriptional regulator GlxA family with amidase domain